MNRRDRWTLAGIWVVGLAAAVQSFASLVGLAEISGVTARVGGFRLAWLLPLSIDVYAVVTTRVWLTSPSETARRYARANAIGAIAMSVLGNATYHVVAAGAGTSALAIVRVILVSAVPPVILGLVVHLHALIGAEPPTLPSADPAADDPPGQTSVAHEEVRAAAGSAHRPHVATAHERSPQPAPARSPNAPRADKRALMEAHWRAERAAGRTPSGPDLARIADASPAHGRRVRAALLAQEASAA